MTQDKGQLDVINYPPSSWTGPSHKRPTWFFPLKTPVMPSVVSSDTFLNVFHPPNLFIPSQDLTTSPRSPRIAKERNGSIQRIFKSDSSSSGHSHLLDSANSFDHETLDRDASDTTLYSERTISQVIERITTTVTHGHSVHSKPKTLAMKTLARLLENPESPSLGWMAAFKQVWPKRKSLCTDCEKEKQEWRQRWEDLQDENKHLQHTLKSQKTLIDQLTEQNLNLVKEKNEIMQELEDLSQSLFEEANKMVSDERRRSCQLQKTNQELQAQLEKTLEYCASKRQADLKSVTSCSAPIIQRQSSVPALSHPFSNIFMNDRHSMDIVQKMDTFKVSRRYVNQRSFREY